MNFLEMKMSIADTLSTSLTGIIVVMIILALLAVIVMVLSKVVRVLEGKKKAEAKADAPADAQSAQAPSAQPANDTVDLYKTDAKTAAAIMAIVSKECGIPLNKLKFNSIRLIEK